MPTRTLWEFRYLAPWRVTDLGGWLLWWWTVPPALHLNVAGELGVRVLGFEVSRVLVTF